MTSYYSGNPSLFERPKNQPSKKARKLVSSAFDAEALKRICVATDFSNYADRVDLPDGTQHGQKRFYYYKDNGSDILAIAHLDSVQADGRCQVVDTSSGLLAVSGTLDDRLGAYVILELLPKLGITCDWLLTTDEEIGASTANEFETHKDYNWMFQFDRGGTDVVMYDYETAALRDLVRSSGAQVGTGTFSDICLLEFLGCAGFNWGVGYEDYHSRRSHAWLEDTFRMVARFVKFHRANADTVFQHVDKWADFQGSSFMRELSAVQDDDDRFPLADVPHADEDWWRAVLVADCGHNVNLDDDTTYLEIQGGDKIICTKCGTMPADEEPVRVMVE